VFSGGILFTSYEAAVKLILPLYPSTKQAEVS